MNAAGRWAWMLTAIVLFTLLGRVWFNVTGSFDDVLVPASHTCTEDMACWDCTSMGNGVCGGGS